MLLGCTTFRYIRIEVQKCSFHLLGKSFSGMICFSFVIVSQLIKVTWKTKFISMSTLNGQNRKSPRKPGKANQPVPFPLSSPANGSAFPQPPIYNPFSLYTYSSVLTPGESKFQQDPNFSFSPRKKLFAPSRRPHQLKDEEIETLYAANKPSSRCYMKGRRKAVPVRENLKHLGHWPLCR